MEDHFKQNENSKELQDSLIDKNKQELLAAVSSTTETLSKLNVSIKDLPQKCQETLQYLSTIPNLDYSDTKIALGSLKFQKTNDQIETFTEDYEILKLKQKNELLQVKIDSNNKFLDNLRKKLECSRESLKQRNPNPDNVQDYIRQLKQKIACYEASFEKLQTKYTKLGVPEEISPKHLNSLITTLVQLKQEETDLQTRAEDIKLARDARKTLNMLRRHVLKD